MATTTVDLETISMDELRKLAEEEARKQTTTTVPEKKEETPTEEIEETEEQPEVKEFFAERSFDLGDGAGSQVYKGKGATREDALEDLTDKLIKAQESATKRIKELKAPKTQEPTITKEQESLLAAELVQKPSETIAKILKAQGIDIEDVKESAKFVKTQKAITAKRTAADVFVAAHPDYADTDHNGRLLNKWCELHNDFSTEGMNKAYQDLNDSGLLQVKGEEAGHVQVEDKSGTRTEPKTEVTPITRVTKKASGVSTHSKTVTVTRTEPTEDELNSMSLDELRRRANQQLAGNR